MLVESLAQAASQTTASAEPPEHSALDLELMLMRLARDSGRPYQLLIIDQFEEVFTRYPQDEAGREAFFGMLGGLMQRGMPLPIPHVHLRTAIQQELDRIHEATGGGAMQGGLTEVVHSFQIRAAAQQHIDGGQRAAHRREEEGRDALAVAMIGVRLHRQERLDDILVARERSAVQRRVVGGDGEGA